ncbi:MAG TPA: hypothetical protein VF897_13995, partial [Roseiflexaceae bacterium]
METLQSVCRHFRVAASQRRFTGRLRAGSAGEVTEQCQPSLLGLAAGDRQATPQLGRECGAERRQRLLGGLCHVAPAVVEQIKQRPEQAQVGPAADLTGIQDMADAALSLPAEGSLSVGGL